MGFGKGTSSRLITGDETHSGKRTPLVQRRRPILPRGEGLGVSHRMLLLPQKTNKRNTPGDEPGVRLPQLPTTTLVSVAVVVTPCSSSSAGLSTTAVSVMFDHSLARPNRRPTHPSHRRHYPPERLEEAQPPTNGVDVAGDGPERPAGAPGGGRAQSLVQEIAGNDSCECERGDEEGEYTSVASARSP